MSKCKVFLFLAMSACLPAQAAGQDETQDLYDQHCIGCHGPEVYTREDRKVTSLPGLQNQVQRCELALGLKWFDDDIDAMTNLLNERFYHFKP